MRKPRNHYQQLRQLWLMARPTFITLFLRQNPRTIQYPNTQIRNFGAGQEKFVANQRHFVDKQSKQQTLSELAKEVSKIIRTRPRWEQTLLSDFPNVDFVDPNFVREVLTHQNNAFLSLRFFYWISSQNGFLLDEWSCNVIFGGLVEAKAANAAKEFLNSTKFMPDMGCLEAYIRCLCENGLIEEALEVFDQLKCIGTCPDLATWNIALMSSVRAGRSDIVWKLYGEMLGCDVAVDVKTVEYLIQAFCMENKAPKGLELLQQLLEAGNVPSNVAFNKLISRFCKNRSYSKVSALLHMMISKGVAPDIYTYQEIIHGLCKRRMRHEGFRIFNDLKDRGYAPDRVAYTTMIHGLCKMKWIGDARKLWFEMIHKGFVPNEYTYNVLVYGFCRTGNLVEAQKLYKEMCDKGYGETTVSYNTMLNGLCSSRKMEEACAMFEQMLHGGVARDVITYNILIQGFCKEGKIAEGIKHLHELLESGLQPTTASYTTLIEKLCELGHVHEAKTLWQDMQDRGLEPAVCSHDCIISGLSEQGYVVEGMEWLVNMLRAKLRPQKETFEALIRSLTQKDKLEDALFVLGYMLKIGYALGECVCHSLIHKICRGHSLHAEAVLVDILETR